MLVLKAKVPLEHDCVLKVAVTEVANGGDARWVQSCNVAKPVVAVGKGGYAEGTLNAGTRR
jgi:hypothetical protein